MLRSLFPQRSRRRIGAWRLALVALAAATLSPAWGAELEVPLQTNTEATLNLPWSMSLENLRDPRGYNHHGTPAPTQPVHRLTIENTGTTPLRDVDLVVNHRGWRSTTELLQRFEAIQEPANFARALFSFWTQARSHAASGSQAAEDPLQMLRFWGYTLCGEDTRGLARLLETRQIPGRAVPLNGHVAGEYFFDGKWNVLDGDQNVAYLKLDNRTLASYEEIRSDPFLALRTKPFGRFASWNLAAAQFNAGLFEYVEPAESRPIQFKEKNLPVRPGTLTLYPGEKLIYHYDRTPERQVGRDTAPEWRKAAPSALRLLELVVLPPARAQVHEVTTPWPLVPRPDMKPEEAARPVFSQLLPAGSGEKPISIYMQCSQFALPVLSEGRSAIELRSATAGSARLRLEYEENLPNAAPPPPRLTLGNHPDSAAPSFAIDCDVDCRRMWWQVLGEADTEFVAPSLEHIEPISERVFLDSLTCTFLNAGQRYRIRAKVVRKGVWSPWSTPLEFQVHKPASPSSLVATALPGRRMQLTWTGSAEEFAIFGSNRLDFLPEVLAPDQIVSMRGQEVLLQRPNQNLVATTKENRVELPITARFWRIMARSGGLWSTPSELVTLPVELTQELPPATVFQIRWSRDEKATLQDIYQGEERVLKRP